MSSMEFLLIILIFIYSVIAHEVMHGVMADYLGDPTARYLGRLTLNPLPHIDPIGSIVLPLLLIITRSPLVFGWAKPVPYNPYNLRNQKYGNALVAGAGVGTNLLLAILFGLLIRWLPLPLSLAGIFSDIVHVNLVLGIFNLIPIPPLDGSKILFDFIPGSELKITLERYGFLMLLLFVLLASQWLFSIVNFFYYLLIGYTGA